MTPETFWGLSLREWRAAVRGYSDHHGGGGRTVRPPRKADVQRQVDEMRAAGKLN